MQHMMIRLHHAPMIVLHAAAPFSGVQHVRADEHTIPAPQGQVPPLLHPSGEQPFDALHIGRHVGDWHTPFMHTVDPVHVVPAVQCAQPSPPREQTCVPAPAHCVAPSMQSLVQLGTPLSVTNVVIVPVGPPQPIEIHSTPQNSAFRIIRPPTADVAGGGL